MSKLIEYVEKFNDGEWEDFSQSFGNDVNNFLALLKRRGLLSDISINQIHEFDEYLVNPTMKFMLESDPSLLVKIVQEYLTDVEIRPDGYYLRLRDMEELGEFFSNSRYRDDNSRDIVNTILGEDYYEPYSDTIYDVYNEIVEELDDKNLIELSTRILELAGNQELSFEDYECELFAEITNEDGFFIITESNIKDVLDDKDAMEALFKGDLNDLKNELRWLGDDAYNRAYGDMAYARVWYELSDLFEGRAEWITKKLQNNPKEQYIPYIKIKDLYRDVITFLDDFSKYSDTFYDHGGYTSMMTHWMEQHDGLLTIRIDDYPDSSKVSEYINDGLIDRLN